jgi:hypothetical protein
MGVESNIKSVLLTDVTEDVDSICEQQTLAEADDLTIDGVFADGGVATLYPARQVAIVATVAATRIFTIVGTDEFGNPQTVAAEYTQVMSQLVTTEYWSTVTSITVNGAATDVTVGDDASFAYVISPSRARLKGLLYVQSSTTDKTLTILDGAKEEFKCTLVGKGGIADIGNYYGVVYIPQDGVLFDTNMVVYGEEGDFSTVNVFYQR